MSNNKRFLLQNINKEFEFITFNFVEKSSFLTSIKALSLDGSSNLVGGVILLHVEFEANS